MSSSEEIVEKSVSAVVSAIEIYNKPDFNYREEAFALLMVNGWELLLKAKWIFDRGDAVESLYVLDSETGNPKVGRSGNPLTHAVHFLAQNIFEDGNSGLEKACLDNINAMIEIRDISAHFINKDIYFGRRIQELGTASLRNYMYLATEWFQVDLSRYNFFLMPISFYHGFETVMPPADNLYPEQITKLLEYLDSLQNVNNEDNELSTQNVALRMETRLVRGKREEAVEFRWTNDPSAPSVALREEDVSKNYPLTYRDLTDALKRRYTNFVENKDYHRVKREIEKENKFCLIRLLNPSNPKSSKQRFYNPNIFQEFDKHYDKRKKP